MKNMLAAFVDRQAEVRRFCDVLEADDKPIMAVWGEAGIGKSSLLARLIHECSLRNVRKAEVFCTKFRFNTYLSVMRKIRDDVGAEHFQTFTQLVTFFYPDPAQPPPQTTLNINISGSQSVLDRAKLENVTVGGDITAVKIDRLTIQDPMSNVRRGDMNLSERELMIYLTDAFIEGLASALKDQLLVVFFDDIQEMAEETYKWLWDEIVGPLRNGRLQNIRLILCGRTRPQLQGDAGMIVKEAPLKPLELHDVENYVGRSGLLDTERPVISQLLFATSRGIPLVVAMQLDAYFEQFPEKRVCLNG